VSKEHMANAPMSLCGGKEGMVGNVKQHACRPTVPTLLVDMGCHHTNQKDCTAQE